jgi:hypothetical protein
MNSKKAKQQQRFLRRQRAIKANQSAEAAVTDHEMAQLKRQMQDAIERGERMSFPKMPVKDRKNLKKHIITDAQRATAQKAREMVAKAQNSENTC